MEWGGLLLCIAFERVGVCPHSCRGLNTGGEGERERETGWRGGWREAGNGTGKDRRKDPGQGTEKVRSEDLCSGPGIEVTRGGWEWAQGASTVQCLKGSLTGKVSLGIRFWQSRTSSVVLLQEVSGRIFEITELFTSMLFFFLTRFYLPAQSEQ